jgi:small subunit ribosomal protein S16
MVTIRLARHGAKKSPFYHIVVAPSRNRRDGRHIERLGYFNPVAKGKDASTPCRINQERVAYWISKGASTSDTVREILRKYANTNTSASAS